MAIANLVRETISTTGQVTSNIQLSGAVAGHKAFSDAFDDNTGGIVVLITAGDDRAICRAVYDGGLDQIDITVIESIVGGIFGTAALTLTADSQVMVISDAQSLGAEMNVKLVTAADITDVCLYDALKDSDGGERWLNGCVHTSWYNETLNTATRGTRRGGSDLMPVVVQSGKVTLYDGADVNVPMWSVFNTGAGYALGSVADLKAVAMRDGRMLVGAGTSGGLFEVNFFTDQLSFYTTSQKKVRSTNLAGRNTAGSSYSVTSVGIVNETVSDVAIMILPTADINPATSLPFMTFAAATSGGVSTVNPTGTGDDVGKITDSANTSEHGFMAYLDGAAYFMKATNGSISKADTYSADGFGATIYSTSTTPALLPGAATGTALCAADDMLVVGHGVGLSIIYPSIAAAAYITKDFVTGLLVGDIRAALMCDTLAGTITDTELVANGNFATNDLTGFTAEANSGASAATGALVANASNMVSRAVYQAITTVVGQFYTVSVTVNTANASAFLRAGISSGSSSLGSLTLSAAGTQTLSFIATGTTTYISLVPAVGSSVEIDNLSLKAAIADRSVKSNHLRLVGTLAKTAVATGADIVWFSGFSASNYAYQAYDADFDYGTGDFCIYTFVQGGAASNTLFERAYYSGSAYSGSAIRLRTNSSGFAQLVISDDGLATSDTVTGTTSLVDGQAHLVMVWRSGSTVGVAVDGETQATASVVNAAASLNNASAELRVGVRLDGTEAWTGKIAQLRLSATVPSTATRRRIYAVERCWFQPAAKVKLGGTSNSVQYAALDESAGQVWVATADGAYAFDLTSMVRAKDVNTTTQPLLTSNNIKKIAAARGAYLAASAADVVFHRPAWRLREINHV